MVPRFVHWQWSCNKGISPCPSALYVRLILPLLYLSKPTYLALNIKTSKCFKPRGHSSSPFHVFMVDEITAACHFPSPHTKKMLKTRVKRKRNFFACTVFLMSDLFILADSLCAQVHGCSLCATCIYPGGFVPIEKGNVAKLMYLLQQESWIYWSHHRN